MDASGCRARGGRLCRRVAGPPAARHYSGTRTRWLPGNSLRDGAGLAVAEFFQGLLPKLIEFAGTDVGLDLLVPKLGLIFTEPAAKCEHFRGREFLNLINDFCRTHTGKVSGSDRLSTLPGWTEQKRGHS